MKDKKREKMIMSPSPTQSKNRQGNSDCERIEVEKKIYILGRGTKKNED